MGADFRRLRAVVAAVVLAALAGMLPPAGSRAAATLQLITVTGGQPDDIAVDAGGHLVWGDLGLGTLDRLMNGRIQVLAQGLSVPEGVVPLGHGRYALAEQGYDRVVLVGPGGKRSVIDQLAPVAGQEGVDGIGIDPRTGDLLVPDSPRGRLWRFNRRARRTTLVASGLGRPVDAAMDGRTILVPDETLGTLVVVTPAGKVYHVGRFSTPDDVAVDLHGRVWVTSLGDGGLWRIDPGKSPVRVLAGLANPQGLTLDTCGDPIVVEQNTARIVRLLLTAASGRCRF